MTKRAHDGDGEGWFKRVLKTLPIVSSFVPSDPTTSASPVRRENFKFEQEQPKNDDKEQDFEFTLKKHTPPSKARKVLDASVHDQSNDDELYVPGTYSEPVVRYAKARREEPIVPVNLFEERPAKQAKLTRGGLIKTYALTREERRQKRPAPSRLLAAQTMEERQEHAKLVTERILATLKSLESDPLSIEKVKPTPSLAMSWKKYELESHEEEKLEEIAAKKSAIPTQSLPLHSQPPVVQPKPFMAPPPVLNSVSPAPSAFTIATTTPAPVQTAKKQATNGFVPQQPANMFSFGLPTKESGFVEKEALNGVPVTFSFSKPPALKVAPVKALSSKKPAVQPVKVVPSAAPVSSPPTFAKTITPTPVANNPLAKFAQAVPGGWRCPSCFVSNQPTANKCPCCDTSKPAPAAAPKPASPVKAAAKPASTPAPAPSSSNPLAKFMTHAPGSWACPSCKVRNQAEQSKCPCCDTPKPVDNEEESKQAESKKRKSNDEQTSSSSIGFGAKDASAAFKAPTTSTSSSDVVGFSFTAPPKDSTPAVTIDSDKPAPSFSFSVPKVSSKPADAPAAGFSFGVSSDKPAASTGFSFGAPAEKPAEKSSAPSLSFGTTPGKPAEKTTENPAVGFSFTAPSDKPADKATPAAPSFSFGAPAEKPSEKPADKPAFSFGVSPVDKPQEKATTTPSFGAPTDKPAEKPSFSFGSAPSDKPADKPSFSFGSSAASSTSAGGLSFGASDDKSKEDKTPAIPAPSFSFGGGDKPADKAAPSFSFGQSTSQSTPATTTADKPAEKAAPSFTFGQSAAPVTGDKPATSFSFGGSPDKTPAPAFGTAAPADKPAFTFGATSDKPAATTSFSFGSSTTDKPAEKTSPGFTFAEAPSSALAVKRKSQVDQSTAFGTTPPNPAVTSTFGSSAPSTTPFGAAPTPSTTFGATPPTTSTFGAPTSTTTSFGAPAPATSTFGAPSTTFGAAPPATTLGASAPGNVPMGGATFGAPASNPPAQPTAFGASAPFGGSTTFNAPAAPAFGAAPAMNSAPSATPTFGAPAASSGFGASTSFGSSAPAFNPPAFGGAAPAAPTGFGGSFAAPPAAPAFGGTNFNAPAASFGGAPAPQFNSGGFGNNSFNPSGAGGFSIGAAPTKKDGTRRRIVRAQTRNIWEFPQDTMENVNIGNYKGVMLCNRPFNSVSTVSKEADSTKKAPFLGGIQPSPVGQNVPIFNEPPHAVKRDKKNTALSKHKKWLYDLQKERERLEEALMEDEAAKEARKERFSKREAEMRNKVRQRMPQDDDDKVVRGRPAWALTKDKADCKRDQEEDEDVENLLEFANNLDIDAFMDDVELKAQVAHVDEQMAQLQKLVNQEEAEEKKQEVKEMLQNESLERQALNAANLARLDTKGNDSDSDDDAKSVASTVLSECKSIRSVHSSRSVLALTKRAEQKLTSHLESIPEPNVVTHDEEGGMRLQNKHLTSNLPYMHRNPAV